MNLTHINKSQRDYLGPVNTNLTQHTDTSNRQATREKEPQIYSDQKINSNFKIEDLLSTIESLRSENQSMNVMVRVKNQQIHNLKTQLKEAVQSGGLQQNKNVRQVYFLNGLPIDAQTGAQRSVQLDRAIYLIKALTKQRDDLKRQCEHYQRGGQGVITIVETNKNVSPTIDPSTQKQQAKLIEQYEEHIASLSSKLSTVHQLEKDVAHLTQQRGLILHDFQNMRSEFINQVGYIERLQNQLRRYEHQLNQRGPTGPVNNHPDFQALLNRNAALESQISKVNKIIAEKDEKIAQIQIGKSGYVQVTKQAFQSMQANINTLQQKLNLATENQRKQAEKSTNFQLEINRFNRQLSQKQRKAQSQSERSQKLESERNDLNNTLSKTKADLKYAERKCEEIKFELQQLRAENEKNKKLVSLSQQSLPELEKYKRLAKQSDQLSKNLVTQLTKIESEYRNMKKQNQQAREFAEESKGKWQQYDKNLKRQNQYIMKLNEACTKRLEEVDINIEKNINLQTKLRELLRINDPLNDEIEQYIKQNQYLSASDMTY